MGFQDKTSSNWIDW